jgi:hypothetical protein
MPRIFDSADPLYLVGLICLVMEMPPADRTEYVKRFLNSQGEGYEDHCLKMHAAWEQLAEETA